MSCRQPFTFHSLRAVTDMRPSKEQSDGGAKGNPILSENSKETAESSPVTTGPKSGQDIARSSPTGKTDTKTITTPKTSERTEPKAESKTPPKTEPKIEPKTEPIGVPKVEPKENDELFIEIPNDLVKPKTNSASGSGTTPTSSEGQGRVLLPNRKKIVWRDISAEFQPKKPFWKFWGETPEKKVVLDQVSGFANPAEITFLMGASGAGKTTLLNVLTQKASAMKVYGEIEVNGRVLKSSEMRAISSYVQQEDIFIGALTVKETLMMAAHLRMPGDFSSAERKVKVDRVAKQMGLEQCLNTKIGCKFEKTISRGERKRLSFACEVLTDPLVLFCDEPTSGLDSFMALQVMKALESLASSGKTIICVIHQPSTQVFEMADRLIILAQGQVAYQGTIPDTGEFFKNCGFPAPDFCSLCDHFMRVLSKVEAEEEEAFTKRVNGIISSYSRSGYAEAVHNVTHSDSSSARARRMVKENQSFRYASSWFTQFRWLFWRGLKTVIADPMVLRVRAIQTIIVAAITGSLFFQTKLDCHTVLNYRGIGFTMLRDMHILYTFSCVYVFTSDMPVVFREHESRMYHTSAYFMGRNLADSIQYMILPILYATIMYWSVGFGMHFGQFCWIALILLLMALVGTSLGYALATGFGSLSTAQAYASTIVVPMMIFGGFFIHPDSIPIYFEWMSHFSWYKYLYTAAATVLFENHGEIEGCNQKNDTKTFVDGKECPICFGSTGLEVLANNDQDPAFFPYCILITVIMIIVIRVFAMLALQLRARF